MENPYGYIYETLNLLNSMLYLGKHKGEEFDPQYLGSGVYLNSAIKKYGKENFFVRPLFYTNSLEETNLLEKKLIKEYREKYGRQNLYNLTNGGDGFSGHHKKESREKTSKSAMGNTSARGYRWTSEQRENHSRALTGHYSPRKGVPLNDEHKEKISKSLIGKNTWSKGRPLTEKHKRNIKIGQKNSNVGRPFGTPQSSDTIKRIIATGKRNTISKRFEGITSIKNLQPFIIPVCGQFSNDLIGIGGELRCR